MTGVGYPQLSAIIECADAAHGLEGHICADGGCATPGDVAKAFGGGADFVMLGGMFAGHDESGGELVERDGAKYQRFYGMSSKAAMEKYSGAWPSIAPPRQEVLVPYRGPVAATVQEILGGVRSACTYVGARRLRELSKRTTFVRRHAAAERGLRQGLKARARAAAPVAAPRRIIRRLTSRRPRWQSSPCAAVGAVAVPDRQALRRARRVTAVAPDRRAARRYWQLRRGRAAARGTRAVPARARARVRPAGRFRRAGRRGAARRAAPRHDLALVVEGDRHRAQLRPRRGEPHRARRRLERGERRRQPAVPPRTATRCCHGFTDRMVEAVFDDSPTPRACSPTSAAAARVVRCTRGPPGERRGPTPRSVSRSPGEIDYLESGFRSLGRDRPTSS